MLYIVWEGAPNAPSGNNKENKHIANFYLTLGALLGQDSLGPSLFDVSAKLFQVFLTAAVKCWKPASPHTYCTATWTERTVQKSKTSQSLSRSRSRSRSQAYSQGYDHGLKCPKVPPHIAYQRTSLYGTLTHILVHDDGLPALPLPLTRSLSKVLEMKPKQRPKRTKNVKQ